jgi:replication factor C subunit 3/5
MLELIKIEQYPFKDKNKIKLPETHWEMYIRDIAKDIMNEQSPKKILEIRTKFYNLITNCIPPELILKKLTLHLMTFDMNLQHQVAHWSAFYEL